MYVCLFLDNLCDMTLRCVRVAHQKFAVYDNGYFNQVVDFNRTKNGGF